MHRSKRVLVLVAAVVALVAVAFIVWTPEWFVASTRGGADVADVPRVNDVNDLAAPSTVAEAASDEARRALEAAASDTAPPIKGALAADAPGTTGEGVVVFVTVADNPWLAEGWRGRLSWSDGVGEAQSYDVANLRVTLPRAPQSPEQFTRLSFDGLAARPVSLEPLEPHDTSAGAATFALRTELEPGAALVWSPTVPREEQSLVHVAFGGVQPPGDVGRGRVRGLHQSVNSVRDVELPFTLPRVVAPSSIWVGAASRQWRTFDLAPDDTRVEVSLERSATLRVLHDGALGAQLVASARRLRQERQATIESDQPIELTDLSVAHFQVWIERPSGEVLTRVANVELAAGVTTEVDLRESSTLDGRGTARIFVRASPEVVALATEGVKLTWVFGEAEAARVWTSTAPRNIATSEEGLTFEALGIDPGRWEVVVSPFCRTAAFDVVAGEIVDVEIVVDCVGFVAFELPAGVDGLTILTIEPVDDRPEPRRYRASVPEGSDPLLPLACGTYRVSERTADATLQSDDFAVTSGATTTAVMRATPLSRVTLAVVDAVTGDAIAFDSQFWIGIELRDDATDVRLRGGVSFPTVKSAYTEVVWKFAPRVELVRVAVPEHPLWTFEPLEPFELVDGATITLRAMAK